MAKAKEYALIRSDNSNELEIKNAFVVFRSMEGQARCL